jgi:two-component system, NarL family, nitrate/nitrite response regulator NarL
MRTMRRKPFVTVVAGSSSLLREGLCRILAAAGFRIGGSVGHIEELLPSSLPTDQSISLVIDAGDDHEAAVGQIEIFKQEHPDAPVAVLVNQCDLAGTVAAYRAGANAYLVNPSCDAFIKSLELVMMGESIFPAAVLNLLDDREPKPSVNSFPSSPSAVRESNGNPRFSDREEIILRYLIEGLSNKVIARKLEIADATVKVHIKSILRKIRVQNRTQAAIWAMNNDRSILPIDVNVAGRNAQATRPSLRLRLNRAGSLAPDVIDAAAPSFTSTGNPSPASPGSLRP